MLRLSCIGSRQRAQQVVILSWKWTVRVPCEGGHCQSRCRTPSQARWCMVCVHFQQLRKSGKPKDSRQAASEPRNPTCHTNLSGLRVRFADNAAVCAVLQHRVMPFLACFDRTPQTSQRCLPWRRCSSNGKRSPSDVHICKFYQKSISRKEALQSAGPQLAQVQKRRRHVSFHA
jgi:hypothetical protein